MEDRRSAHVHGRKPNAGTSSQPLVAMDAGGVTVVLDLSGDRLPAIVHWGASLPGLSADEAVALAVASELVPGPNDIDVPRRLAVVPELAAAWPGRPGLNGSRAGRCWSPRFLTTSVTLDGVPLPGFVASGPGVLRVDAVEPEAELELAITVELLPSGLLRSRAAVTNVSSEIYQLEGLTLAYPVPGEAAELLDFAGRWGRERVPQRLPFRVGTHLRENRKGRTGADAAYVLHAGTPGFDFSSGQIHAVHTAHSGNHVHYAERVFSGQRVLGGGELLLPDEIRLGEGQTYESPWFYGCFGVGLDEVARRFHAHLRARPRPVPPDRPVTLNVWEAVYFDHRLDRLLALADRAAEVGVERYVLDDGWFGSRRDDSSGLGDWVVSPDVWPEGLHPLVDHVRALGMEFGLWFEPEMVNPDSDLVRAHPEWVMAARSQWPVESRHQQVLNLAIPEAYDHVKQQILALVDEYDIDFIKWDHNRDLIEAGSQVDGGRPVVHAQTAAFYSLLDELRSAHPDLEIESCSSGGARIDLGVLERTDRVWVSDCIDPLERQHITRWTTQLIPPEYMGSHIASGESHTTGRRHRLGFRAATALFGHLGIEWDLTQASDAELDELRAWLAFYKEHRRLLLAGDVVRVDGYDDNLLVHGVVAPDRSEAVFAMAVVGSLEASPGPRIRLRGLTAHRRYRLQPVLIGPGPSGLRAPRWWHAEAPDTTEDVATGHKGSGNGRTTTLPGVVVTGRSLEQVGVTPPVVHPEEVVLFHCRGLR